MRKKIFSDRLGVFRSSSRVSQYLWVSALLGIAILLGAVATLQYRWNMQIRNATENRLGEDLESVMLKWHLNLYREFSTICIALQVGPDSGAHQEWIDYLRRYEEWRSTSDAGFVRNIYSNPYIVGEIYIYQASRGRSGPLFRLNADSDKIVQSTEPADLQPLLAQLQGKSANLRLALHAWQSEEDLNESEAPNQATSSAAQHESRTSAITGWQFDESIPAIVHPIVHHDNGTPVPSKPVDWLVVVLNKDAITNRILPELTQRYFEGSRWSEYDLAVLSIGQTYRLLLYSSSPRFGLEDTAGSDSVMNIFGPPPESTEGSFWQVVKNRESLRGDEWHSFSGPVWFPIIQRGSERHRWMMFLKHRTGSLEASITKAWRTNLFVGITMLLLLAITMMLLIVATKRAKSLAAMQMDFVASISHELQTPLAAVLSAGQNLTDGFADDVPHYGSLITAQARQLIDLVEQILLFVAVKDGKKKYELVTVSLDEVIDNLRQTTLAILEKAGFKIDCRIEDDLPCVVGDKQAVLRCLRNLVENAAKYSGNNRWIGIFIELDRSTTVTQEVRISVVDHGIGIADSELKYVFEPFYRSPKVAARIRGSGLGLPVVKHIIKDLGGRVSVETELGVGSTFTLHLRVAERASLPTYIERQGELIAE